MERRDFLMRLLAGFKSLALFNLMQVSSVFAQERNEAAGGEWHYRPLGGVSLRDIAANRLHHGANGRFVNPLGNQRRSNLGRLLYWKLFSENEFEPHLADQPLMPVEVDWQGLKKHKGISVTFIKHASVLIKDGDTHLLVDPVFDSLFWFIKDYNPLAFDLQEMPRVDHLLITHGHYDHLSRPTLSRLDRETHVITPLGYDGFFNRLGMSNRSQLDWYQSYSDHQRRITLLPCNHWTMRNPITGPNRSLWGSYVLETAGGKTIYISGDTAYFDGFEEIGRQFDIDLAIINLGAYEPRWFMAPSHMNPAETVLAFLALGAKRLMVVHWGSFRLGNEPVHFPPLQLREAMTREGLADRLLDVRQGETLILT